MLKGAIGAIPIFGTALNEAVFEARSRIKQERINNFINEIRLFMETLTDKEFDDSHIKEEYFIDFFEAVSKKVMETRSKEKLKIFRKIVINEMINPKKNDVYETYLDIISRTSEIDIRILNFFENGQDAPLKEKYY